MNDILAKISSYNIFNNLFPGAVFVVMMQKLGSLTLPSVDIVSLLLIYYFVGMTISRIGSLVLEPFLKLIRFVRYARYPDYISACGKDTKIEVFLEVSNTYRTLAAAFLLALAIRVSAPHFTFAGVPKENFLLTCIAVIFLLSFKKQTSFINKRVEHHTGV